MATSKNEDQDLRKLPKDERPRPSTGQSGDPIGLKLEDLNEHEAFIVHLLDDDGEGQRPVISIEEMSTSWLKKDKEEDDTRAKLLMRNALRRLVADGWVERTERARYRVSEKGRKRLRRQAE